MKADIYGSRSFMMALIDIKDEINIDLTNSFIGTNLASQECKEVPISKNRMKRIVSEYELIEIRTDLSKRLRRFKNFKESNIIFIDFMHEGKDLLDVHNGTIVDRPVLNRYGYDLSKAKLTNIDRIKNIEKNIDDLLEYISNYKVVILVKMRNPKYIEGKNGTSKLKKDFHQINKLNSFAEMCEDLLADKMPDIPIVELYKDLNDLRDGYQKTPQFKKHLKEEVNTIINIHKNYL